MEAKNLKSEIIELIPYVNEMTKEDFNQVYERLVIDGFYYDDDLLRKDRLTYILYSLINGLMLDGDKFNIDVFDIYKTLNTKSIISRKKINNILK
jgi:hypothetical protein